MEKLYIPGSLWHFFLYFGDKYSFSFHYKKISAKDFCNFLHINFLSSNSAKN